MNEISSLKRPIEELRALGLALHGKVDDRDQERLANIIDELERCGGIPPNELLMLLGIVIQNLPSIVAMIDVLMNRNR